MTIHGPRCDVCDSYILLDNSINPFHVNGCEATLLAHDKCIEQVKAAFSDGEWFPEKLPNGPLKAGLEGWKKSRMEE